MPLIPYPPEYLENSGNVVQLPYAQKNDARNSVSLSVQLLAKIKCVTLDSFTIQRFV
jgi:hypothetical protein